MVQCDDWLNAVGPQLVNEVMIITDAFFIHRASAIREYPAPCNGKAVGFEPHLFHQSNVFFVVMILVAGHFCRGKAVDLVAVLVDDILLAQLFAVLLRGKGLCIGHASLL